MICSFLDQAKFWLQIFLSIQKTVIFLPKFYSKVKLFVILMLRRSQLNGTWCSLSPSLHNLAVSTDFMSLSGIPYCPVYTLCQVFGCMHAYSLPIQFRRSEWAVGTHACIHSQKESAKFHIACISHTIRSILKVFIFDIAPSLHTLHTPQ